MNAAHIGRNLVNFEEESFVQQLTSVPLLRPRPSEPFHEAIERAMRIVQSDEMDKQCILLPLSAWKAVDALGLRINFGPTPDLPEDLRLDASVASWYQGQFLGAPVLTLRAVTDKEAFVVSLARLLTWSMPDTDGERLQVAITSYDRTTAELLAREQPELAADEAGSDFEARVEKIRELVLLHVRGRLVIRVANRQAGRRVSIPPTFVS